MTERIRDTIFDWRADYEAQSSLGYATWLRDARRSYFDNQADQILSILGTLERGTTFYKGVEGPLRERKRARLEITLKGLVKQRVELMPYLLKL